MNVLQRALVEKVGRENGWENVIASRDDGVRLGSARHRARAGIASAGTGWRVELPGGRLSRELARTLEIAPEDDGRFVAADRDALARLLRRAAELSKSLPDQAAVNFRERLAKTLTVPIGGTEIERIVRQRVGQDVFRDALMDYWGGACAVTGLDVREVLRASHAKPWSDCESDQERLDVFNGFLLVANLDALFDRGLIGFDDSGSVIVSTRLSFDQRTRLGLEPAMTLRWLADEHRPYVEWHRNRVFRR